ncbi:MAG: hypothetical protein AAF149_22640, partial [Bacteroidota bacterium]
HGSSPCGTTSSRSLALKALGFLFCEQSELAQDFEAKQNVVLCVRKVPASICSSGTSMVQERSDLTHVGPQRKTTFLKGGFCVIEEST